MTDRDRIDADLGDEPARDERTVLVDLGETLLAERPVPAASFRARLRADLLGADALRAWRPRRLRLTIAAYTASGLTLLLLALAGVSDSGPLAPADQPGDRAALISEPTR